FVPMFKDDMGQFVMWQFVDIITKPQIVQIIMNSIMLGTSVGIGATFFGLIFAIYTTRIAKRSAFIARIFSILPIVTPPFVVGLGVTLMLGRSGYITELMA
ncbi:iron ABC transporter permease, partial [Vibrio lentus]|nr:iron ABC transporter permease [Vibrio lentus]